MIRTELHQTEMNKNVGKVLRFATAIVFTKMRNLCGTSLQQLHLCQLTQLSAFGVARVPGISTFYKFLDFLFSKSSLHLKASNSI